MIARLIEKRLFSKDIQSRHHRRALMINNCQTFIQQTSMNAFKQRDIQLRHQGNALMISNLQDVQGKTPMSSFK